MTTKHCVLLAEDDRDEVYLARWAFLNAGLPHQIIDVPDGAVTIEYLKGTAPFTDRVRYPFPRLLLLDLKMPKVNGFEVLAWLRTRPEFSSLPVVVLSSSVFQVDSRMARDLGAREFLSKPYRMEELVALVQGLHERWLVGEQPTAAPVSSLSNGQTLSEALPR